MTQPNPDRELIRRFIEAPDTVDAIPLNPMAAALGLKVVRLNSVPREIELAFTPTPIFLQGVGVLQGGAVAGMLDFAMAFALLSKLGPEQSCATINLTTSYLRAAPIGEYRSVAEIERQTRSIAFLRAKLFERCSPETVIATAQGTFAITASQV
ncbi:TPA: PaaI family thioesterase [Burkholderia cepacia]|nr:PaaI family thioesterase [Burkholderia cepacia]MCA8357588.1 PaaI family thioesterase [Burkholderia cepacia]HDR9761149.1 PaaI family thioesterase [Burkholderia cepacia ATCC 25416]HDV6368300.1 PaaI family thioesterase [Burkholderia cepacia]